MGKRGDRKRLMHRMRRTARRIPLGATNLPPWLKSHFPTIYARHVAYRMINGQKSKKIDAQAMWIEQFKENGRRNLQAAMKVFQEPHPNCKCLLVPPALKQITEKILAGKS